MSRLSRYSVSLEEETGNGRADIIMRPNRPNLPSIIFELKKTDSDNPEILKKQSEDAIDQIKKKNYCSGMKGRTLLCGICFHGKESTISMEEITP